MFLISFYSTLIFFFFSKDALSHEGLNNATRRRLWQKNRREFTATFTPTVSVLSCYHKLLYIDAEKCALIQMKVYFCLLFVSPTECVFYITRVISDVRWECAEQTKCCRALSLMSAKCQRGDSSSNIPPKVKLPLTKHYDRFFFRKKKFN